MNFIDDSIFQKLNLIPKDSHKNNNGKVMIIGGSKLFHGASLFALKVASRIVDIVFYYSIVENQELTKFLKSSLYSFINIPESRLDSYIEEAHSILIGPGMVRENIINVGTGESGEQTREITMNLLNKFPQKQWIIDAGSLQVLRAEDFINLKLNNPIITPHLKEFQTVFDIDLIDKSIDEKADIISKIAKEYNLTIVLKGVIDLIADKDQIVANKTGNEGMTKGGTGDCLAGLISALSCRNDAFTACAIGAYINGLAGDELYQKVGPYFNADDLVDRVPEVLWKKVSSC